MIPKEGTSESGNPLTGTEMIPDEVNQYDANYQQGSVIFAEFNGTRLYWGPFYFRPAWPWLGTINIVGG